MTVWWPAFLERAVGAYLVTALQSLGYRAKLRFVVDAGRHFETISDSRNRIQAGGSGWIADYPAESGFIRPNLTCEAFIPGSVDNLNYAGFCDPKIDPRSSRQPIRRPQASSGARSTGGSSIRRPGFPCTTPGRSTSSPSGSATTRTTCSGGCS